MLWVGLISRIFPSTVIALVYKLLLKFVVDPTYMKRSKKIFLVIAAIFLLIMLVVGYDISTRTAWPGAKKNLKERIEDAGEKGREES